MSEKQRQKKDGRDKNKKNQATREGREMRTSEPQVDESPDRRRDSENRQLTEEDVT
jgi:hypothetical protein